MRNPLPRSKNSVDATRRGFRCGCFCRCANDNQQIHQNNTRERKKSPADRAEQQVHSRKGKVTSSLVDTKVVAVGTSRHRLVLTELADIAVAHVILGGGAITKELLVAKHVLQTRDAPAAVVTGVRTVTRFVLAIAQQTGPAVRAGAVHAVSLRLLMERKGVAVGQRRVVRKVGRALHAGSVVFTFQVAVCAVCGRDCCQSGCCQHNEGV